MLLQSEIRNNSEEIIDRMKVRNIDITDIVEKMIALDKRKREIHT